MNFEKPAFHVNCSRAFGAMELILWRGTQVTKRLHPNFMHNWHLNMHRTMLGFRAMSALGKPDCKL